jgi:hypothetical protein
MTMTGAEGYRKNGEAAEAMAETARDSHARQTYLKSPPIAADGGRPKWMVGPPSVGGLFHELSYPIPSNSIQHLTAVGAAPRLPRLSPKATAAGAYFGQYPVLACFRR